MGEIATTARVNEENEKGTEPDHFKTEEEKEDEKPKLPCTGKQVFHLPML